MSRKPTSKLTLSEAQKLFDQAKNNLLDAKAREKALERKNKKKRDDHRKILAGACALTMMQTDPEFAAQFSARLRSFLTRDVDRDAFAELFLPKK